MDYASKVAVLGPLSPIHDPTALDLCPTHADAFSAPQGWKLVRYRERNEQG